MLPIQLPETDERATWASWMSEMSPEEWTAFTELVRSSKKPDAPPPIDCTTWNELVRTLATAWNVESAVARERTREILNRLSTPTLLVKAKKRKRSSEDENASGMESEEGTNKPTAKSRFTHKIHTSSVLQADSTHEVENLSERHKGILASRICGLVVQTAKRLAHEVDADMDAVSVHTARQALAGHGRGVGIVCTQEVIPLLRAAFDQSLEAVESGASNDEQSEVDVLSEPDDEEGHQTSIYCSESALHRNPQIVHVQRDRLARWRPKDCGLAIAATNVIINHPNAFTPFYVTNPTVSYTADAPEGGIRTSGEKTFRIFLANIVENLGDHTASVHKKRASVKSVLCRIVEVFNSGTNTDSFVSLCARNTVGNGHYFVAQDRGSGIVLKESEVFGFKAAAHRVRAHVKEL